MSNKVKTIYENKDGTELKPWLDKESNRRMLDNKRILYVVRANIDNSLKLIRFLYDSSVV